MSKSITVSSCAYSHTEDINPDEYVNADRLDDAMDRCVNLSVTALDQPSAGYNDLHRANIASIFKSIQSTKKLLGVLG